MNNGRRPIPLRLPDAPAVEAYLKAKGWVRVTPADPGKINLNALVYRGGSDVDGNPLTVALPARPDLLDADRMVSNAIRFLAILEAKSLRGMAQEIIRKEHPSTTVVLETTGIRRIVGQAARNKRTSPPMIENSDKTTKVTV